MLQFDEYKVKLNNLKPELELLGESLDLESAERELDMLQAESASDGFWDNVDKARKVQQRISQLEGKVGAQQKRLSAWEDLMVLCEMGNEEEDESLVPELEEGFAALLNDMETARLETLLSGEYDNAPAIVALQAGAGGISMDWGWSYARMAPATVTVKSDGSQSISPALSNSYTNFNVLACVSCQYFWDCTASTMNRTDAPEGYKGECWVFHVNDFTPDASKDLYLTFALASSQTGPMYFDIEWGEEENGPLSAYTKIGEIISPDWYSCHQLQQFILKLPDEMKSKQKFTIRFRVTRNWNAGNGMVNGSSTESTTVAKGGAPRISFWQIAEI